jgi:hypothetical protein
VPTRKQRRRELKSRRHEYELVYVDEEGNEVEVDPDEVAKPEKTKNVRAANTKGTGKKRPAQKDARGRPLRAVPAPTWGRSLKRAAIVAILMFALISFMQKSSSMTTKAMIAIFYGILFVPMSFMLDRSMYRNYLRRSGQTEDSATRAAAKTATATTKRRWRF